MVSLHERKEYGTKREAGTTCFYDKLETDSPN